MPWSAAEFWTGGIFEFEPFVHEIRRVSLHETEACVVNKEELKRQNERYQGERKATKLLDTCIEKKDLDPVLTLLLDDGARKSARQKALEYLVKLNDLSAIDPLRNHNYIDPAFASKINVAITLLLKKNFKKECPHCSELIKSQAQKCMHCKEDL